MHGTGHVYRTQFGNFHRRPQNNHHENHQNTQPSWGAMLHFLPMIFLFLFTFWGGRQESAPYSLNKESMYNQEMFTKTRNVPFYVHDKRLFAREYPEQSYQRNYLEREVGFLLLSTHKEMYNTQDFSTTFLFVEWTNV